MANGGARPGAGRPKLTKKLSNYDKSLGLLNDNIIPALKVLVDGLKDEDKRYRFDCAELLLKKALPDQMNIIDPNAINPLVMALNSLKEIKKD